MPFTQSLPISINRTHCLRFVPIQLFEIQFMVKAGRALRRHRQPCSRPRLVQARFLYPLQQTILTLVDWLFSRNANDFSSNSEPLRSSRSTRCYLTLFQTNTVNKMDVFRPNLFEGKVLFCTGGGSGICKVITQMMVSQFMDLFVVQPLNHAFVFHFAICR